MRFRYDRAKAIASICLLVERRVPNLTKGKVDKLIFLADKLHLVRFGRPITGDWYAALPHGPVPSSTDDLLDALEDNQESYPGFDDLAACVSLDRAYQYPRLVPVGDSESSIPSQMLSKSDIAVLEEIIDGFGERTFGELRALTHELPAYVKAWEGAMPARGEMAFEDFFEEDENAIAGVRDEAVENCCLREKFPEPAWG